MARQPVIEVINAKKVYRMGTERVTAVNGVSFEIYEGEFCCLLGTSGSGKSTLLNLMAGIEKITSGVIKMKGRNICKMSEKDLAEFRQKNLGFVFQSYNLLGSMTAMENVEFPLVFKRIPPAVRRKSAREMLIKVGLKSRLNHLPKQMSGGQQQRVGIARAFVAKPQIVFADEPTGNLDTKTTMEVMELIRSMAKENHQTIVMVTHDPRLARYADKIIHMLDGDITKIEQITPLEMTEETEEVAADEATAEKEEAAAAQETTAVEEGTTEAAAAEEIAADESTAENETDGKDSDIL